MLPEQPNSDQKKTDKSVEKNVVTAAKAGGIGFAGKLAVQIISLGFAYILARFLGAEDYGLYKLAILIITILSSMCLIGLDGGVKRFIPMFRLQKSKEKIWGIIRLTLTVPTLLAIVVTVLVISLREQISEVIFDKPDLAPILGIAALVLPILTLTNSLKHIAIAYKRVDYTVYAQDIGFNLLKLLTAICVIFLGFGIMGVTVAFNFAVICGFGLLFYFFNKFYPFKKIPKQHSTNKKEILSFSFPLFLSLLLNQFGRNFEILILGVYGVFADVGVYSVILNISLIGNMAFVALRTIANPIFSELSSQSKFDELRKFYQLIGKWALAFNIPIFLIILIFADNLLLIFGKEFAAGSAGLIILAASTLFNASMGACGALLNMSGYSKVNFINSLIYLICTFALDFLLIPKYGLLGAAWAGSLTIVIVNTIMSVEVYFLVNRILPFNKTFLKPIIAGIVAGLISFGLKTQFLVGHTILQLVVITGIMITLYVFLLKVFKLSPEDWLIINKVADKFRNNHK